MRCRNRPRLAVVLVVSLVTVSLCVQGVAAAATSTPVTPENESAPFRILAGDDDDPNRTVSTPTAWSVEDGTLRSRRLKRGPPTHLLDGGAPVNNVTSLARETDGARTTLHRPVFLPVADDWQPVADAPVDELRVIADPDSTTDGEAGASAHQQVALRHERLGVWLPVSNASVRYTGTEHVIENPDEATVNVGTYHRYNRRLREGQRALLETARDPARVSRPVKNGTPMVTAAGGQVPTRWSSVRTDAIRNHWATIARASPGAFDGDRLLVGDAPVRLFVPGDFTGHVPPAWSEEESCGPEGQTTRRWERWSIVGVDQTAAIDGRVLRALGPGIYRIEPPNATTLTIEHTASLELGHEWGIDDDCGPDRRHSDTLWVNHTVERRLALRRVRSENLSVTAFVLTRPGRPDEVHYHVEGNRGLRRGGLGSVTLSMGAARHTWHTPWAFYPVRGYDAVRIQRRNGTTLATVPTAFRTDARFPNLYRDRLEAERHVVTANQIGFLPTVRETGAPTENRPFDTAVKTAAAAESLYTHYGGRVSRVPDGSLEAESIDLTALTVLGEPVETNLHIRRFRVSTVSHRIAGQTVAFHLTSNGKALSGRALGLRGARRSTAVTNESGWIQVRPMDPVVGVAFAGTGYRPNRTAYYEPARSAVVVPSAIRHSTWTVPGAVFGVITGATGVIGWIAIGWILRWQRRRRPKNGTL